MDGDDQSELPKDYYAIDLDDGYAIWVRKPDDSETIFTYTNEYAMNILHYDQEHVLDSDKQIIELLNDQNFLSIIPRTSNNELWSIFFEKSLNGELDFPETNDSIIS